MKNRFLPLMMLLCFACSGIARAAVVQIGEDTYVQNSYPIKTDWEYSLTQQIYTAEEIGTKGTINALSFQYIYADACNIPGVQLYMKTTQKNKFNSHYDMLPISPSDKVWEGTFSASGMGWVTVFLDTPFEYDGTSNLLVCFYSPINGFLSTANNIFYASSAWENLADSYYSHDYIPDIADLSSYQGYAWTDTYRANIRIDITPVMIGSSVSATTEYALPVNMYYNYSLTQQIFTAEEIGTAGTINFIAFDYAYNRSFSMENVRVYMKNVLKDSFETNTDMVAISSSDKVWEGTFSATGMGWVTLTLDTPFEYDGNSNLLVCFYDPTNGYPGFEWKFRTTSTTDNQAIAYYSDNSSYIPNLDDLSSYGANKSRYQYRSNIQIGITPDLDWVPCEKPQNLVASVYQGYHYAAWVEWADGSGLFNVEYKKATDTEWTRYASNIGRNCLISPLEDNTEYKIRVQSVCGTTTSGWTYTTHTTPRACNLVSDLRVTNLTYNSVEFLWDALESGCDNRLEWKKSSDSEWIIIDHVGCGTGLGPGLDPNTSYDVRVAQYCPNGYQSDWAQISFTTKATVPFLEEFPNSTIPTGWTIYTGLLNDVMNDTTLQTTSYGWNFGIYNGAFSDSNHAYINIYGTGRKHWLVTPQVMMQNNCQLSFELALTQYSGSLVPVDPTLQPDDRFVVLASTDVGATWTILREWNNTGSPYVYNNILATGEDVAIDLSAYQGTNLMIAFYGESTVGNNGDNDLHIDNVSIDYIPTCQKPTNFHVSSIAERSVVLSWDAPEGQNHWEVGYKTDDDPYYQWFTEPTENPYLFSGHPNHPLQPETHYTVKVHALCDGSGSSSWSKEIEFTTLEACPVPTNLHITHVTPHGVTAYFDPGSPTQTIWYYNFTTTNTPPTYTNGSTTYVQHFIYYPEEWQMFEPETHYYLWVGIKCEEGGTTSWAWGEPAEFTTPSACPPPTDLTITDVTPHGVSATFNPGGDWQTEWGYFYTTTNEPPGYFNGATLEPSAIYPEWLHALQSNTHYYLWVGIECEENGTTTYVWGEPAEFTTPYACSSKVDAQDVETDNEQPHEVSLDWGDSPATADQWQVYYSYDDVLITNEAYINQVAVTTDEPYVTIDGLFSDLDYYFWIRPLCEVWEDTPDWGEWSDMITVHTQVTCSSPINVTVSDITSTSAYISWEPGGTNQIEWEVTVDSDAWGTPYTTFVNEPYLELDLEDWVDEGEDLPCTVYVHANCGQEDGWSAASETVGFILTDKEQLTVNDGTATNEYIPIYGFYCDLYSKGQFIIPAEDIEDMQYSEISWMTFYANNDYVNWGDAEFEVYMMELPCETEFASATLFDWYDMELVRSEGSLEIRDGLMVVNLEEPFYYTDGNLVIGFKQTVSGSWEHSYWYGVNTNANTALGGFESSKGLSFRQFLPKTSFVYEPNVTPGAVCRKPKDFVAEAVTTEVNTVEFSWTPSGEGDEIFMAWGLSDFDPEDRTTWIGHTTSVYNPGWMTGFEPETTYYIAARTVCGQSYYSNWTCPISITMPEACPTPTNIQVTDITTTSATISWENGEGNRTWIVYWKVENQNTCLSEDFENGTFPDGWTIEGDNLGERTWRVGTGDYSSSTGAHGGDHNVLITHNTNEEVTYLVTPYMNLSGQLYAELNFSYVNRKWINDIDEFGVYYRVPGGTWHELFATTEAHETWTEVSIPLTGLAGGYQIGFKFTDHYGYGVGIDDITVKFEDFSSNQNAGFWIPSNSNSITLESFSNVMSFEPNTTYRFALHTGCPTDDGEINSHWAPTVTFSTLPIYTFVTDGDWNNGGNWNVGTVPPEYSDVVIEADVVIPDGYIAYATQITLDGGSITIADGGQLRSASDVEVTVEKNITGYGTGNGNYYLISVPFLDDFYAGDVEGLIAPNAADYDLYDFNPMGANNGENDAFEYREWRNYKADPFLVYFAYGYLYANKEDVTLKFTNSAIQNNFSGRYLSLSIDEDTEAPFGNWFLAGNFYTCNCYMVYVDDEFYVLETNFYVMNEAGTDLQLSDSEAALGLCEGAFVEIPADGALLYLTYDPFSEKSGILNITLTEGEGEIDQARIRFGKGNDLGKLSLREKSQVYIPREGKELAVAYTDRTGEMPVNFKAKKDGRYTMSFSTKGVNFSYLHLIDNLTGEDIDLLDTLTDSVSEYTFEARTADNPDRFKVVFVTAE